MEKKFDGKCLKAARNVDPSARKSAVPVNHAERDSAHRGIPGGG